MDKAHVYMTKELLEIVPKLYETEETPLDEKILYVKYFTPDANWTWYMVEYDENENLAFGFVVGLDSEWGYFSLDELSQVRGSMGLKIERDLHFKPIKFKNLIQ